MGRVSWPEMVRGSLEMERMAGVWRNETDSVRSDEEGAYMGCSPISTSREQRRGSVSGDVRRCCRIDCFPLRQFPASPASFPRTIAGRLFSLPGIHAMTLSALPAAEPARTNFVDPDPLEQLRMRLPKSGRVEVRLWGTTVVLSGQVTSYYDKQVSQEAARRVPGVNRVVNLIVVQAGRGTAEWITRPSLLDAV